MGLVRWPQVEHWARSAAACGFESTPATLLHHSLQAAAADAARQASHSAQQQLRERVAALDEQAIAAALKSQLRQSGTFDEGEPAANATSSSSSAQAAASGDNGPLKPKPQRPSSSSISASASAAAPAAAAPAAPAEDGTILFSAEMLQGVTLKA